MGKRTMYQERQIAQLTLDFTTRDCKLEIHEENSEMKNEEMPISKEDLKAKEKYLAAVESEKKE